jgi:ActR/RegA family two-component response regulator
VTGQALDARRIVLLAEDDDNIATVFTRVLERNGFAVHRARAGSEAIGMVAAAPHLDAAIVDLVLPGAGGLDVVAAIRRAHAGCRIVAVTGFSAPAIESAFLAAGADRFLAKPVELADLLAALDVEPA